MSEQAAVIRSNRKRVHRLHARMHIILQFATIICLMRILLSSFVSFRYLLNCFALKEKGLFICHVCCTFGNGYTVQVQASNLHNHFRSLFVTFLI